MPEPPSEHERDLSSGSYDSSEGRHKPGGDFDCHTVQLSELDGFSAARNDLDPVKDSDNQQWCSTENLSASGSQAGTASTDEAGSAGGNNTHKSLLSSPPVYTFRCFHRRHHNVSQRQDADTTFRSHLVDFWFIEVSEVCSNCPSCNEKLRHVAIDSLARSQAVDLAIQCISAAYLQRSSAKARNCLSSLLLEALITLRKEIGDYLDTRRSIRLGLPAGLLFATFVLGSATMMIGRQDMAVLLRGKAAGVLHLCQQERECLDAKDDESLSYFQRCLVRWSDCEMFSSWPRESVALSCMSDCFKTSYDYADPVW